MYDRILNLQDGQPAGVMSSLDGQAHASAVPQMLQATRAFNDLLGATA